MKPGLIRLANTVQHAARTRAAIRTQSAIPTYPVIERCPSPTCRCAEIPPGLDVEREKPLNDTMVAHAEELLVLTGQSDWASKIEDEKHTAPWGEFVFNVKQALGKGGKYFNPYHNVTINTCSFDRLSANTHPNRSVQALLFPSFKTVEDIDPAPESVTDFVETFLLPFKLHPQYDGTLSEDEKRRRTRRTEHARTARWASKVKPITTPVIMVCSHNSRDARCGILGPLLHTEFTQYINKRHTLRNRAIPGDSIHDAMADSNDDGRTFAAHPDFRAEIMAQDTRGMQPINVGMISHIGGHKWAGNVIVYIPPEYHCNPLERIAGGTNPKDRILVSNENVVSEHDRDDEILDVGKSPLAGKIIWYGRVEPKHVEGIVEQTIGHGRIIRELYRGGVNSDGSYVRI